MSYCKRILCGKVTIITATTLFIVALFATLMHPATRHTTANDIENLIQKICAKPNNTIIEDKKLPESLKAKHLSIDEMKCDTELREDVWDHVQVKGAFYMMTRNEDLPKAKATIKSIEDRFNGRLGYPWIFLNNQKFSPEFKKYIKKTVSNPDQVYFGQVDLEAWNYPPWIDSVRSQTLFTGFRDLGYPKINRPSYSNYLRYQSGLFFHHPLFDDVDYVWRVDAGSYYSCEMFRNDPFQTMQEKNKSIGFSLTERATNEITLFSLWPVTKHFMNLYPNLIEQDSIYPWLTNADNEYNMCQISTSFEILSLSFLKSEKYRAFFYYLDLVGGFFYERWTDAAVRTVAAALFLKKQEIYFFNDVAYAYKDKAHCPLNFTLLENCACDYKDSFDYRRSSCTLDLLHIIKPKMIDEMISFAKIIMDHKEEEESILQSVPLPLFSNKSFLNIDHSRYQDWQSKTDSDPSSDITAYSYLPKEALCLSQF
ncbi:hypothetical protein G6F37_008838 [Rhizopus arrhizus]|nr:hypothetical protein G6F38_001444 [Rhizopus arrhizus]KAG1155108.1 hypothetical protein G6F37_008838 [Rhizopus arrhizus]